MVLLLSLAGLAAGIALLFFGGRISADNRPVAFIATTVGMFLMAFSFIVIYETAVPLIDSLFV